MKLIQVHQADEVINDLDEMMALVKAGVNGLSGRPACYLFL